MSISKSANTYNRQNWETAEFPILCQTCLGENPYLRMIKEKYGRECKICQRPFTVFRWCPGPRMRYKKTEICQTCSKLKNACQTCLFDLEYGLPIQVRDHALQLKDDMPKTDVNKEYFTQQAAEQMTDETVPGGKLGKSQAASDLLMKLARTAPYYKRNRPHICSFWVKGECKRGEECPYRHEMPSDPNDPLSKQNLKDRYYGIDDPVADKLLRQAATLPTLTPPEDRSITSLYVGGLGEEVGESDLRDNFYQFGEIREIRVISKQSCAFVTFTNRKSAEAAAEKTFHSLIIKGRRMRIMWGRGQGAEDGPGPGVGKKAKVSAVPGLPGVLPPPPDYPPPPPDSHGGYPPPPPGGPPGGMLPPPLQPPFMAPGPPPGHPPPGLMGPPPGMPMAPNPSLGPGPHHGHGGPPPGPPPGVPPPHGVPMRMRMPPPRAVHYPSQDPHRMGGK